MPLDGLQKYAAASFYAFSSWCKLLCKISDRLVHQVPPFYLIFFFPMLASFLFGSFLSRTNSQRKKTDRQVL